MVIIYLKKPFEGSKLKTNSFNQAFYFYLHVKVKTESLVVIDNYNHSEFFFNNKVNISAFKI
jgi:hypothetical protein